MPVIELGDLAAVDHRRGLAQVLDPRVGAGADEDPVEGHLGHRRAGLEPHVGRVPARAVSRSAGESICGRVGNAVGDLDDHPWIGAPGDHRRDRRRRRPRPRCRRSAPSSVGSSLQRATAASKSSGAPARPRTHSKVVSSGAIIPARPPPSIVMLQIVIRPGIYSASIAGPAYSTAWPTMPPVPRRPIVARIRSFGVTPGAQFARVGDPHRLRPLLHHALGREHVLDLGGADPEGQRAEGAVGRGVAVAADDRHPRLGDAQLRADHVDDPLPVGAEE